MLSSQEWMYQLQEMADGDIYAPICSGFALLLEGNGDQLPQHLKKLEPTVKALPGAMQLQCIADFGQIDGYPDVEGYLEEQAKLHQVLFGYMF